MAFSFFINFNNINSNFYSHNYRIQNSWINNLYIFHYFMDLMIINFFIKIITNQ